VILAALERLIAAAEYERKRGSLALMWREAAAQSLTRNLHREVTSCKRL
jgi:hypothetical protein